MTGSTRDDETLAGFDVKIRTFDVEHHLAVDDLDEGIEGSEMFGESLTGIKTEQRHTAGITVDEFLTDDATFDIVDQLTCYKHFSFLELHSQFPFNH